MSDEMTPRMPEAVRVRALMVSYQSGHVEAFDELYALVSPSVRRYLASRASDRTRIDDVVQDTFLQMHRARHTYDPSYPLMPWVLAIARHCWLMHLRTARRRPTADEGLVPHEPAVRADADRWTDDADVREALGTLPTS